MKIINPAILLILLSACGDDAKEYRRAPAPPKRGTIDYAPYECEKLCHPNAVKRFERSWGGSLKVCECWNDKDKQ